MDYAQQQRDPTRHLAGFSFVLLLHVLIVYALVTGLARKVVDVIKKPIEMRILEEVRPPPPPQVPPPAAPKLAAPPPPFIPPPEVQIAVPPPAAAIAAVTSTPPPAPETIAPAPPPVQHVPVRVPPQIDFAHNCAKPEYPALSRRIAESGTVDLKFLVDTDGHAIRGELVKSSGHRRLDDAALSALGLCHFRPGTQDGAPVPSVAFVQYVWRIQD